MEASLPAVPGFIAVPPNVQELIVAAVSPATQTTTILSGWAVPIAAFVYVATLVTESTPAGSAVLVNATAIYNAS